jgi:hypothetical protein
VASSIFAPEIRSKRGGVMRTRGADCLTEPGIVCPVVAHRSVPAVRVDTQRLGSTRPVKKLQRLIPGKIRFERGGVMRTRGADCLTEPGIVCPVVAHRPVPAIRVGTQRLGSTRPAKEFRRPSSASPCPATTPTLFSLSSPSPIPLSFFPSPLARLTEQHPLHI